MLDALLTDLSAVAKELLPIVGAVALIYLCILLKHAWKMIDGLSETVDKLDPTIKLANKSMEKVQAPLDTAVKLSHSVDDLHEKSGAALTKAAKFLDDNASKAKSFVEEKLNDKDSKKSFKNPFVQDQKQEASAEDLSSQETKTDEGKESEEKEHKDHE